MVQNRAFTKCPSFSPATRCVHCVITLFLMLLGVLNRTELSPDGASIFSGILVGMFVFIAMRTIEITSCADANMAASIIRLPGVRGR